MKSDIAYAIIYALALIVFIAIIISWFLSAAKVQADGDPVCTYVYSLSESAIDIPCKMYEGIQRVWMECESRDAYLAGDPSLAVGLLGELGAAQIHVSLHGDTMRRLGLDPFKERDRIIFAAKYLWSPTEDFRHWSCAK